MVIDVDLVDHPLPLNYKGELYLRKKKCIFSLILILDIFISFIF